MTNRANKLLTVIITLLAVVSIISVLAINTTAHADTTIAETLNIAEARKNMEGPGYKWANRFSELTLNGVKIDTADAYGLRLPKDCTVILKGKNYIKAEKYGLSCSGTVTFKGDGSLVIDAGEAGIYLISQNNTHKVRLLEGNYEINAGKYGVLSQYADFSFVGSSMKINVRDENGLAISGRCVNLLGGSYISNAPVISTHELVVDGLDINITATEAALVSPSLRVDNIKFKNIESYNGESTISGTALKRFHSKSIILGEDVSGWVDYILLAVFAILVAALIIIPTLRKKRKAKLVVEHLKSEGYISE